MDSDTTFFQDSNFLLLKIESYSKLVLDDLKAFDSLIANYDSLFLPNDSTLEVEVDYIPRETLIALKGKDKAKQYFHGITTFKIKLKDASVEYLHTLRDVIAILWGIMDFNYKIHDIEFYGDLDD